MNLLGLGSNRILRTLPPSQRREIEQRQNQRRENQRRQNQQFFVDIELRQRAMQIIAKGIDTATREIQIYNSDVRKRIKQLNDSN